MDQTARNRGPYIGHFNGDLCSRKSTLETWWWMQELKNLVRRPDSGLYSMPVCLCIEQLLDKLSVQMVQGAQTKCIFYLNKI